MVSVCWHVSEGKCLGGKLNFVEINFGINLIFLHKTRLKAFR